MDPDPDPEGPKTCGSAGSGSATATLQTTHLHGIDGSELERRRVLNKGLQHRLEGGHQLLLRLHVLAARLLRHKEEDVVYEGEHEGGVGLVGGRDGGLQPGQEGGGGLRLQLPPDLGPQVQQGEQEGQLVLLQHSPQLLLSPAQNIIQILLGLDPDPHGSASFWEPGSASFWEPGSASSSNKNQDPDPHQRDKLDLDPDPHQFADDKPKCMEYEH
jgi:hypothetical protein